MHSIEGGLPEEGIHTLAERGQNRSRTRSSGSGGTPGRSRGEKSGHDYAHEAVGPHSPRARELARSGHNHAIFSAPHRDTDL